MTCRSPAGPKIRREVQSTSARIGHPVISSTLLPPPRDRQILIAIALVVLAVPVVGQHLNDATLIDPAMSIALDHALKFGLKHR
jgi:hypothetical protein